MWCPTTSGGWKIILIFANVRNTGTRSVEDIYIYVCIHQYIYIYIYTYHNYVREQHMKISGNHVPSPWWQYVGTCTACIHTWKNIRYTFTSTEIHTTRQYNKKVYFIQKICVLTHVGLRQGQSLFHWESQVQNVIVLKRISEAHESTDTTKESLFCVQKVINTKIHMR